MLFSTKSIFKLQIGLVLARPTPTPSASATNASTNAAERAIVTRIARKNMLVKKKNMVCSAEWKLDKLVD